MKRRYQIIGKEDKEKLSEILVGHGQFLLPMGNLIERLRVAVDDLIEVLGRASIEGVFRLSAQGVAGPKHQGRQVNGYRPEYRSAARGSIIGARMHWGWPLYSYQPDPWGSSTV